MILRSGKVAIKRPKHSSPAYNDEIKEEEDIVSRLTDELLIRILCLVPEADANRTRILSNRWKDLWAFLPYLHFVMPSFCRSKEEANKFHDSVDKTLALRDGRSIQRFLLHCSKNCNYDRVYNSLITVVKCQLQQLELSFLDDKHKVRFCWDSFKTCNTLVWLTLKGPFLFDVPESELLFPCLKKLDLLSVVYSSHQSFVNLISGCLVLEELCVERHTSYDKLGIMIVNSPSLKRLHISCAPVFLRGNTALINVPNLEYLYILDPMSGMYSLKNVSSLVEAHISMAGYASRIVGCFSNAKRLTLTSNTIHAFQLVNGFNMPVFPNMVNLVIGVTCVTDWTLMLAFLNNMPNLEHLTFSAGLPRGCWDPPVMEVPDCLSFKMKEIIILNPEDIIPDQYIFIRFLLKHSTNLETFTINDHDIPRRRREQLLNFNRASKLCRFEFV